jgi:hypothetical protein
MIIIYDIDKLDDMSLNAKLVVIISNAFYHLFKRFIHYNIPKIISLKYLKYIK